MCGQGAGQEQKPLVFTVCLFWHRNYAYAFAGVKVIGAPESLPAIPGLKHPSTSGGCVDEGRPNLSATLGI